LWSLPVRTAVKVNGVPYDRPANPYHAENDSLILGTDVIPSPGFSRVRMSPLSFSTAIDLTWMRGSLGHAPPRGTLRSQLASRASLLVPHRSFKALRSYMCYQMPSGCLSLVGYIDPQLCLHYEELISSVRQMARSGRSLRTWRVTTNDPRSNIVASAIHSFSSCARMIPSVYSLESLSVARYDGKICHPWEKKFVAVHTPYFLYTNRLTGRHHAILLAHSSTTQLACSKLT
jgi:hypothetical protein